MLFQPPPHRHLRLVQMLVADSGADELIVVVTRLHVQVCLSTLGYCRKRGTANSCAHVNIFINIYRWVYGRISLPSLLENEKFQHLGLKRSSWSITVFLFSIVLGHITQSWSHSLEHTHFYEFHGPRIADGNLYSSFIQTRKCPLKLGSQGWRWNEDTVTRLTSQAPVATRLCRETWGESSKIELDL